MDGSTEAANHCFIVPTDEMQMILSGREDASFSCVRTCIAKLELRRVLSKPWFIFPINLRGEHWVCAAVLNPFYLDTPQEKRFTAYLYFDPASGPNAVQSREDEFRILRSSGVLNFLICGNLEHGSPPMLHGKRNPKDLLEDPSRFCRVTVPSNDTVQQSDGDSCGVFVILCIYYMATSMCRDFQNASSLVFNNAGKFYELQQGEFMKLFVKPPLQRIKKRLKIRRKCTWYLQPLLRRPESKSRPSIIAF